MKEELIKAYRDYVLNIQDYEWHMSSNSIKKAEMPPQ